MLYRMENHLEVFIRVYRPAPSDPPTSLSVPPGGRILPSRPIQLTGSWTRHRSPLARKLVPHFHGHCSQANAADTINGIEPTEAGVPPYILRGQTEYTMLFILSRY